MPTTSSSSSYDETSTAAACWLALASLSTCLPSPLLDLPPTPPLPPPPSSLPQPLAIQAAPLLPPGASLADHPDLVWAEDTETDEQAREAEAQEIVREKQGAVLPGHRVRWVGRGIDSHPSTYSTHLHPFIHSVCIHSSHLFDGSKIESLSTHTPTHPPTLPPRRYETLAGKHWDLFYQHNQANFFKDRHYLQRDFPDLAPSPPPPPPSQEEEADPQPSSSSPLHEEEEEGNTTHPPTPYPHHKVLIELGCGVGNSVFPLLAGDPNLFVYALDFAPKVGGWVGGWTSLPPIRFIIHPPTAPTRPSSWSRPTPCTQPPTGASPLCTTQWRLLPFPLVSHKEEDKPTFACACMH